MNLSSSRRNFLRTARCCCRIAAIPALPGLAEEAKKKIPIALSGTLLRSERCPGILSGVLEMVGGNEGYQGVEFAGHPTRTQKNPSALRKLLDDNGLKCCGTHTPSLTLQGDDLKNTDRTAQKAREISS